MAAGLDEGAILLQQEVPMNAAEETFVTSYDKLMAAMSELFFGHWEALKKGEVAAAVQTGQGTYHTSKDLKQIREKTDFNWNENIAEVLDRIQNDRN